ncbi:MAG: 4-hydroxybutyrate CoA-transferase, partial [Bacteroidetes bacterium]|nr:4-hydroxybutyrate CoA-transferase [Bacteroidota bacterium]
MVKNYCTAEDAVKEIKSGQRVFVHGSASTPSVLLKALFKRTEELKNVELMSISTLGDDLFNKANFGNSFFINSLFVSQNVREIVNGIHGDYIPVFLSEIPILFNNGIIPIDVALIHVSEPDKHGFCSLGTSVDIARSAVKNAKYIIAQVNKQMPKTHGDGIIHINQINTLVRVDEALPEVNYGSKMDETTRTIGKFCAELIEDRSTLQMGVGAIPDAVLNCLKNHKDLGVHTEMFSDGLIP